MDEISAQLELARQVQQSLLPRNNLNAAGWAIAYRYLPYDVVSGDYLDIVEQGPDAFYFALGDVSGKGVAASLMMSHLYAAVRALLPIGLSIEEVVRRVSRNFCEASLPAQFATLVLGKAERQGRVVMVNAGHTPVLVLGSGGIDTVNSTGLPLGMFCTTYFESIRLDLSQGATLLIYSDGVSEALESDPPDHLNGDLYDLAKNSGASSPDHLLEAIEAELGNRASAVSDDRTILVLQRGEMT